tara:strand:- start:714 stop:1169 length:456 start_codon:yes stop_codon:yes gene_type:complete
MASKKVKPEIIYLHGDALVPAKSLSYKKDPKTGETKAVPAKTHKFENELKADLAKELKNIERFPTKEDVFVSIIYGFHSKKEFKRCDLDNRAKTILDALEGPVYDNDSQVRMLWTHKAYLDDKQESFYRISVKILDEATRIKLANEVANFI